MRIGIPKEVKVHEYRVGATPDMVRMLVNNGHHVVMESQAGTAIGYRDDLYQTAGAQIGTAADAYACDLIVKVKEPQPSEFHFLRRDQILFCFLHLAAEPELTQILVKQGVTAIAYEMVTDKQGRLPLLIPMSEIAGRIAIQAGATALQLDKGGKGILLGGVPGVPRASVVIIGAGVVGTEAAKMAMGLNASVTILDRDIHRLRELDTLYAPRLTTRHASPSSIEECVTSADLVIGAVLIPGKRAPRLVTHAMIKAMSPGSVVVDVSIDQGGCIETSHATTHADPTYVVDGVVHYCVSNMPGACALTATQALTNATCTYILALANKGVKKALAEDPALAQGLSVHNGSLINEAVEKSD